MMAQVDLQTGPRGRYPRGAVGKSRCALLRKNRRWKSGPHHWKYLFEVMEDGHIEPGYTRLKRGVVCKMER